MTIYSEHGIRACSQSCLVEVTRSVGADKAIIIMVQNHDAQIYKSLDLFLSLFGVAS
jgi:hypothetical protein